MEPAVFDGRKALNLFGNLIERRRCRNRFHFNISLLGNPICIKEGTRKINNLFPAPIHDKAWILRHLGNNRCFQVLFISGIQECL